VPCGLTTSLRFAQRECLPLPKGKYGVFYGYPPWAYEYSHKSFKRIDDHYPTMSLEEICNMGSDIQKLIRQRLHLVPLDSIAALGQVSGRTRRMGIPLLHDLGLAQTGI